MCNPSDDPQFLVGVAAARAVERFDAGFGGKSRPTFEFAHTNPLSAHCDSETRPIHVAVSTRVRAEAKSMFHSGGRASGSSA
jgi:hypothetical protein